MTRDPTKQALRHELRRELAAVAADERLAAYEAVHERVHSTAEIDELGSLLVCLSFGVEVETWSLVASLVAEGRKIWAPRVVAGDQRIRLCRYPCVLETLPFGLRQPAAGVPELDSDEIDEQVDGALVLGLGFERDRGYRLGHGAGFFDRFFAAHDLVAIGIATERQMRDRLPTRDHDIPMDLVVTDERVYRFGDG